VEWALTGLLVVWMLAEAVRYRGVSAGASLWPASLALVLTHFVSPRTATTHFGSLLLPFFLLARLWHERDPAGAIRRLAILVPALAVASWALFLLTVQGRQESAWNYLPIPILLVAGLLWARHPWTALVEGEA
jgi:hypothetical protein